MLIYAFALIASMPFYVVATPPPLQTTIQVAMQPDVTKEMIMSALGSFRNDMPRTRNSYNAESEDQLYNVKESKEKLVGVLATCFVHG